MTSLGQPLTSALEDYLETIFQVIRDRDVARVRDIARARDVKPGSVTPALKRLEDLSLIRYERREFIRLTPAGEEAARRVVARHSVLVDFFTRILKMPADLADRDACSMEHSLSDTAMDRLVALFEFIQACPDNTPRFLQEFHEQLPDLGNARTPACSDGAGPKSDSDHLPLSALKPGEAGRVQLVQANGAIRQRLLDMGMLPGVLIEVERTAAAGDPIWIRLHGYQLSLRRQEARAIQVVRAEG